MAADEHEEVSISKRTHTRQDRIDRLKMRSLASTFPPLAEYLRPGIEVLDVGCGPGNITIDVAEIVAPGHVTGIDESEPAIQQAIRERGVDNLLFRLMDARNLEFADRTFDLTYSHSIFEWLKEPAQALREQMRVTKSGGWVVAGAGIYEDWALFPRCDVLGRLVLAGYAHVRARKKMAIVVGSHLYHLFAEAGFERIRVVGYVAPIDCAHKGSQYFEYNYGKLKLLVRDDGELANQVDEGLLSRQDFETARNEIEQWHGHPHAFTLRPEVLVAAQMS